MSSFVCLAGGDAPPVVNRLRAGKGLSVMIYRPSPAQIHYTAEKLIEKYPVLRGRCKRAAEILEAGDLYAGSGCWQVIRSGRHDGSAYQVDGRCECADYANGALKVAERTWCKHRLAVAIYRRILCEALQHRILGDGRSVHRRRQETWPNTYLLLVADGSGAHLWSERDGLLARVSWWPRIQGWRPACTADALRLACWLGQADRLPSSPAEEMEPSTEWSTQLTSEQHRRWLRHGVSAFVD